MSTPVPQPLRELARLLAERIVMDLLREQAARSSELPSGQPIDQSDDSEGAR